MSKSPLYAALGTEIRNILRKKNITQAQLARELTISRPAASQLLNGKIHLSKERLEQILHCIGAGKNEADRLRQMYSKIQQTRDSGNLTAENFNLMLRERKLSLPMLSNRTGVPIAQLTRLKQGRPVTLSPGEKQRLKKTLDLHSPPMSYDPAYPAMQEPGADMMKHSLPLLNIDDFSIFKKEMRLRDLVLTGARQNVCWELTDAPPAAAVLAQCSALQLTLPGIAVLAVRDASGNEGHVLELRCSTEGKYSIFQKDQDGWKPFFATVPTVGQDDPVWRLPVLDIVFKLFTPEQEKEEHETI